MVEIVQVRSEDHAAAVYKLAYEFIDWLHERYPEMSTEIATYLEHQKFDEQIRQVLIHYAPPRGECLLAIHRGEPVGVLMLKDLGDGVCEMNRMFVRQSDRGLVVVSNEVVHAFWHDAADWSGHVNAAVWSFAIVDVEPPFEVSVSGF